MRKHFAPSPNCRNGSDGQWKLRWRDEAGARCRLSVSENIAD
jgi:hypothetical protein